MESATPEGGRLAVRIGDAERDECMSALSEHHARGRLSVDELDRRQTAALAAVTEADLAVLLSDLPGHAPPRGPLAATDDWWSLDPKVRALRMARWASAPLSLAATGVLVASANTYSDERQFYAGFAAAGMGYLTHLVLTKWPRSHI